MTPPADPERYKNHRFPGETQVQGVMLNHTIFAQEECQLV